MKNWLKHYISPHILMITTIFMGFLTIAQIIIDWCGIKISHIIVLIVIGILYLLSIIVDIYLDRLALKKELNALQQNNNGLQQNINQLISDKNNLQKDLKFQEYIKIIILQKLPNEVIDDITAKINLIKEISNLEKTNQNSKNN